MIDKDPLDQWRTMECSEHIVLSERDTARVLELLKKPPKPTPALLLAAKRRATRRE